MQRDILDAPKHEKSTLLTPVPSHLVLIENEFSIIVHTGAGCADIIYLDGLNPYFDIVTSRFKGRPRRVEPSFT